MRKIHKKYQIVYCMVYSPGHSPWTAGQKGICNPRARPSPRWRPGARWCPTLWRGNRLYGLQLPCHKGKALGQSPAPIEVSIVNWKRDYLKRRDRRNLLFLFRQSPVITCEFIFRFSKILFKLGNEDGNVPPIKLRFSVIEATHEEMKNWCHSRKRQDQHGLVWPGAGAVQVYRDTARPLPVMQGSTPEARKECNHNLLTVS